jgi:3-isopropylmalate/(R)-2-methylmalate dehydratase small subunit
MAIEVIETIAGTALPLRGHNIDTDRIVPARFLRSVSFEGLENHLFEDDVRQAEAASQNHPISDPKYAGASILVVNRNFGCGSSREHAPQAIRRRGFHAVIGESFSEIFFGNSVALGMPCVTARAEDVAELQAFAEQTPRGIVTVSLTRQIMAFGGVERPIALPAPTRESFLAGTWDATALLLDRFEEVEAVARRLPYAGGWAP